MIKSKRLYTDSVENSINSLESLNYFLDLKMKDDMQWKWIIFALHHCFYHFCINNLEGTDARAEVMVEKYRSNFPEYAQVGENPWMKSVRKKDGKYPLYLIDWDEIDGEPNFDNEKKPKEKVIKKELLGFWTALERVQDGKVYMKRFTMSKPLELSDDDKENILRLVDLRNTFMHFEPMGYSIEFAYIIALASGIIDLIERVALKTNQVRYRHDSGEKERVKTALKDIRSKLDSLSF